MAPVVLRLVALLRSINRTGKRHPTPSSEQFLTSEGLWGGQIVLGWEWNEHLAANHGGEYRDMLGSQTGGTLRERTGVTVKDDTYY